DPRRATGRKGQPPPRMVERLQPGRGDPDHARRRRPVAARRQHGLGDRPAVRVMRHLAALAALLLAAPAAGQARPAWAGVWQGTISRLPVRLCIDARDGAARGSYYYLSELEPIALGEDDGEGG